MAGWNESYDNLGSGIIWISSLGGRIADNNLHGNCAGIMVSGYVGDFGVASGDVSIQRNRVTANNRWCPADGAGAPDYGGIGIALVGAQNTKVADNQVRNNRAQAGSAFPGGGIVIASLAAKLDTNLASNSPTGNSVQRNELSGNSPFDIYGDSTGSANRVRGNSCHTTN